jgi:predicted glutamine amidotransferase
MCRWNAYVGEPLVIGELLYRTRHGLIDESLHARMGAETTNGDGFGVGWYGSRERAVAHVESKARERGVESPVQMTVGISDGERLWAIRYSSQHDSRTLFVSADLDAVRRLHPDNERLRQLSEGDRVVVSEPLADLTGAWLEVPESTALVVADGAMEQRPFQPSA